MRQHFCCKTKKKTNNQNNSSMCIICISHWWKPGLNQIEWENWINETLDQTPKTVSNDYKDTSLSGSKLFVDNLNTIAKHMGKKRRHSKYRWNQSITNRMLKIVYIVQGYLICFEKINVVDILSTMVKTGSKFFHIKNIIVQKSRLCQAPCACSGLRI